MSKTDKTRPWWVRALDRPDYLREVHHHESGPCALPDHPTEESIGWSRDRCHWYGASHFWYTAGSCGCPMCTQQDWRRRQNRSARHRWNQALHALDPDALDDFTA